MSVFRNLRRGIGPALALAAGLGWADRSPAGEEPAKPGSGVAHFHAEAEAYRIALDAEPPRDLTLRAEPILKWNNPVRRTEDGAVLLWTDRGRPGAVASFYQYKSEGEVREAHEFASFATEPLTARVDEGQPVWAPRIGLIPTPIPDAPRPAGGAAERSRQARSLAREFRAYYDNPPDQSEVRPLPQPLYHFDADAARPEVLDGSLFAFVHTTDPEVLLLIEARATAGGGLPAWHYAIARMTMVNVVVRHKDREVWRAPWDDNTANVSKPYITLSGPRQER